MLSFKENIKSFFRIYDKGILVQDKWSVDLFPDYQIRFGVDKSIVDSSNILIECSIVDSVCLDLLSQMSRTFRGKPYVRVLYLYGARSDKYSNDDGTTIYCNVASGMVEWLKNVHLFQKVSFVNPHCPIAQSNSCKIEVPIHPEIYENGYNVIVFPDASARSRFASVLPDHKWLKQVECVKLRDDGGNVIKLAINGDTVDFSGKRVLVMDDICDGGRTFLEVRPLLRGSEFVDLSVTHAIFSNNADDKLIQGGYRRIYTTNSYRYWVTDNCVRVQDIFTKSQV